MIFFIINLEVRKNHRSSHPSYFEDPQMISHRSYYEGRCQVVVWTSPSGHQCGLGLFEPGRYELEPSEKFERVEVLSGDGFHINQGQVHISGDNRMPWVFPKDEPIVVEVKTTTAYRFVHSNTEEGARRFSWNLD